MTSRLTAETPTSILERAREDLYRIADRAPALSRPLSTATRSITEVLAALVEPTVDRQLVHEQLLAAANSVAAARSEAVHDQAVQIQLAATFGDLERLHRTVQRPAGAGARPYLRLVHSS